MSNYVADKVRPNRAAIKNLVENPDGSSACEETVPGHESVGDVHSHDGVCVCVCVCVVGIRE